MKARALYLIFCMLLPTILRAQENIRVTWDYKNQTFSEFVAVVENIGNLRVFYKDEWVKEILPGDYGDNLLLFNLLDNMFRGRSLYFFTDEDGNVIITKDFAVKISPDGTADNVKYIAPADYYLSEETRSVSGSVVLDIGNPADKNLKGNVSITGYITDTETKEPVAGATVYVQKLLTGTTSNEYGFYSLSLPRGSHLLQYSFIGMKEKQISVNLYGPGEINVEMSSVLIPLKEMVVTASKDMTLQRFEVGLEKIDISSFKLMPTSMGEADIIKSVLMIPGVKTIGEASAGFNVRGGSADQNLILLYGAPLYNSSHFFGFFPAINSDIIKDVTVYKGGIPGRYGSRISSVIDIQTKEGNRNKLAGNAGISPVTAQAMIEGPLIKDTCTFLLSGRTTYSNWLINLIDYPPLKKSRIYFYDVNGKISYDINRNNKIEASCYYSHDLFRLNNDTLYSYDNFILAGRWRHFYSSRFFSVFSLNNSFYSYNIAGERTESEAFILSHRINTTGLKADFNLYMGRNEFNFGGDLAIHKVLPGKYLPFGDSSLVIPDIIEHERAIEPALYFEDKIILTNFLSVNAGIRLSSFYNIGPKKIMIYDPGYPKSISTITDTLSVAKGRFFKSHYGPELRLSLNCRISMHSSFKLNYNRTRQYLHLLTNTISISPTDIWKLSDYHIKPQAGGQYAAGFYHVIPVAGIEASAEIYYKKIKNMIDFKGGTIMVMNRHIEKDIAEVSGKAYGLELMIKRTEGKLRWNIGYTWSRALLRSTGKFSDETINSGNWFPANFDRPHDLAVTTNYLLSRRFSLSASYVYSTGRPVTYPVTLYYQNNQLLPFFSDRNKYRIPYYSRLDISWKLSGNLKSKKIVSPTWILSVYNLLSRQNVYSVFFRNEKDVLTGYRLSIFAQAIPSVTLNFDF